MAEARASQQVAPPYFRLSDWFRHGHVTQSESTGDLFSGAAGKETFLPPDAVVLPREASD